MPAMSPDRLAEMHRFVDERYKRIAEYAAAGYTRKEIATAFKVAEGTVMAACRRHGIEPKPAVRAKKETAKQQSTSSEQNVEIESDDREIERRLERVDGALEPGHKLTWGVISNSVWPGSLLRRFD